MCGIAGFSGDFDPALLERMSATLAHRGPDDSGSLHLPDADLGLAHRRLSIIDLSARGHQPMWDVTRTVAITYNGEIYNYRLNLYLRDGDKLVERLNGIFAFAIWDTRSESLLVARDGVGVKPLYYAETPKGFLFASELKALLHEPSLDRALDHQAIRHHLLYLWCPAPLTMLRAVHKLEPGHAMRVKAGRATKRWRFYDLPLDQEFVDWPEEDAIVQIRKCLTRAVERQLVSDVPVGAFLSGGLDSSSVVALAQRRMDKEKLQCFTIGFGGDEAQTEGMAADLPHARSVAEHLNVDLHTIYVGSEMVEELQKMVFYLDEPQADPAPINALFITQLAREHGIKVLLSGAGGDDIFTGYRRHYALMQEPLWSWLPPAVRRAMRAASASLHPTTELRRRLAKAFRFADLEGDERMASYFYWIPPDLLQPVFHPDLLREFETAGADPVLEALASLPPDMPPLHRMLYLEGKFFLTDHNLNYVDKVSMANSVEVRVPLLDPDLTALAARLPVEYKQRGRIGKWVLRKAMQPYLPRSILHRPKTGFGAPLRHWLRGDLRPVVDDVLSDTSLLGRGLFDPRGVKRLVEMDRAMQVDATYTIFSMICVELWCRMFIDKPTPSAS
jgi:asparagine synthase (glutamine-hydrolysing)